MGCCRKKRENYNEENEELEFVSAEEIAEDGTVEFAFTHASDYAVVVDDETEEENNGDAPDETPKTGDAWKPWWILFLSSGLGIFLLSRKREAK